MYCEPTIYKLLCILSIDLDYNSVKKVLKY